MNIKEFLRRFDRVKGPSGSGEYMAKCPCHDDSTASLSIGIKREGGRDRIVFDCHAGCDGRDILKAVGVTTRELYDPEDPPRTERLKDGTKVHTVKKPDTRKPQASESKPQREEKPGSAGPKWDLSRPAKVYSYTDASGNERFQVCRFETEYEGRRVKTFRQRRYAPDEPKANATGYVWSVPEEIRDTTLYRLPQLLDGIREGRTVYLVEGEKDVETLARLGQVATCNPGGAGKWRDGYTALLKGADVVILPDNDPENKDDPEKGRTGQKHAWTVACALQGVAKRVRVVDLTLCCPELPSKGDISDMVEKMGDQAAMDTLARVLAVTRDFDPDGPQYWLTPLEQAAILYDHVQGYGVDHGCIIQYQQGGGKKPLTDFVAIMRQEVVRDDGATQTLSFTLDGWTQTGQPLPRVSISAEELDRMSWVTGKWGSRASVAPGSTNGGKVSWCIKKVAQKTAQHVTEYMHTGWRRIGGQWCYLYHGGAIGHEGVTVDMGEALRTYQLGGSEEISYAQGAEMSKRLMSVLHPELGAALLGVTYLAPLREWLAQTDTIPAFCLFLHGITGTHKTTAASLAMAHFGNFHGKNPPASFNDTANQIRKKAFLVKDMPLLVDDYHPTSSVQEARQMAATAQAISRAFGDGSDRGRLNADRTVSGSTPPRSVAIITGEDLPNVGESGLARYYIIEMGKNDVPITKELTELQEAAREGYLQRSMRGYITWLSKQTDKLPERLHDMFIQYREAVRGMIQGTHDRAPETVACLLIGYSMMLYYFRDLGVIDATTAARMMQEGQQLLIDATRRQAADMRSQKPSVIFLSSITELLASRDAAVCDLTAPPDQQREPEHMIGYMDRHYYYLLPNVAFSAVSELCRRQETRFPVTLKGLYKHLKEDGVCGDAVSDDSITRNKRIKGKAVRLLWIPRGKIDGEAEGEQVSVTEYMEVMDEDDPF